MKIKFNGMDIEPGARVTLASGGLASVWPHDAARSPDGGAAISFGNGERHACLWTERSESCTAEVIDGRLYLTVSNSLFVVDMDPLGAATPRRAGT